MLPLNFLSSSDPSFSSHLLRNGTSNANRWRGRKKRDRAPKVYHVLVLFSPVQWQMERPSYCGTRKGRENGELSTQNRKCNVKLGHKTLWKASLLHARLGGVVLGLVEVKVSVGMMKSRFEHCLRVKTNWLRYIELWITYRVGLHCHDACLCSVNLEVRVGT